MPSALVARVIDTQANQQFEVTFERFPVRIGRNQLNDLQIDRPYVSQFHAAIDVRDRQIFVRDLGSTNGTAFAGRRLERDQPIDVTAQRTRSSASSCHTSRPTARRGARSIASFTIT